MFIYHKCQTTSACNNGVSLVVSVLQTKAWFKPSEAHAEHILKSPAVDNLQQKNTDAFLLVSLVGGVLW